MATSSDVFDETITYLRYRISYHVALNALDAIQELSSSGAIDWHWVDEHVLDRASETCRKYGDLVFPMIDCTSFALCEELGISHALAPDRHFEIVKLVRVGI